MTSLMWLTSARISVLSVVATLTFSHGALAQAQGGLEVLDTVLRGVHSLHVVSSQAKHESKRASAEGRPQDVGRLRSISAQANGLSGNLYNRIVPQITSASSAARTQQAFQAYMRYDFGSLLRAIQSVNSVAGPEYSGAVLMMSSSHDELGEVLRASAASGAAAEVGYMCTASDQGTEEHAAAHVAVGPTVEYASEMATAKCMELHAACKPVRCVGVRAQLR